LAVFRDVLRIADVRRVEAAWLAFNTGEWAIWVAILVYAYVATGPGSVGIVAVAQLLPAAIAAPLTAKIGDRMPRGRALTLAYATTGTAMVATGLAMFVGLPPPIVYVLAASVVVAYTSIRPIQSAILPAVVGRAEHLTAANALSTVLEGTGVLFGPLLCGVILTVAPPATVYVGAGVATLVAALLVGPLRSLGNRPVVHVASDLESPAQTGARPSRIQAVKAEPGRALAITLLAARFGVAAAMDVLLVFASIEYLGMGQAGAGFLSAAIGVGWVAGGALTVGLVGRPRLTPLLLIGASIWAVPVVGVARVSEGTAALLLLVGAGIGLAVVDVAVRTVLQRLVPVEDLPRVFGLAEGASMGGAATGALVAGVLVAVVGLGGAIVAAAVTLPLVALAIVPTVGRDEAAHPIPFRQIALLRRLPLFAPLAPPALEAAAAALSAEALPAGTAVITEGEVGDHFYAIEEGEVQVSQGARVIGRLGPGSSFGELALIRDIPRTASVVAVTDVALQALERHAFLLAITASEGAADEAERIAAAYRARDDGGRPTVRR
jgi:MFS family permease